MGVGGWAAELGGWKRWVAERMGSFGEWDKVCKVTLFASSGHTCPCQHTRWHPEEKWHQFEVAAQGFIVEALQVRFGG